jgi:hypothetical protein
MSSMRDERVVPCVGGLAYDTEGRLLRVQRANDPRRGWSRRAPKVAGKKEPAELWGASLLTVANLNRVDTRNELLARENSGGGGIRSLQISAA